MATKMVLTREKPKHSEAKEYVFEREWKKEARKVAELEKELKKHERTDKRILAPRQESTSLPDICHADPSGHGDLGRCGHKKGRRDFEISRCHAAGP